jgi:hypothetical protein
MVDKVALIQPLDFTNSGRRGWVVALPGGE